MRGSLYRGVRERERKRDTWIASIGWGCDRAGLRGGGFVGVLGLYGCGFWAFSFWGSGIGVSLLFLF